MAYPNLAHGSTNPGPLTDQGGFPLGGHAASNTSSPSVGSTASYWLPIWSGEAITAYDQYNVFEQLMVSETIQSGTTKRFPVTGTIGIKPKWLAGEELSGDSTDQVPGWFDISLDQRPMASYFEVDDIGMMLTQWDFRAELARQAGQALANTRDSQLATMIGIGAFTAARGPHTTGGANTSANIDMDDLRLADLGVSSLAGRNAALLLLEKVENFLTHLQEINADTSGVYLAVTPKTFAALRSLGIPKAVASPANEPDWAGRPLFGGVAEAGALGNPLAMGLASYGDSLTFLGVTIIKSMHLPTANTDGTWDTKYDFTGADKGVKALIWKREGICSLRLQGLKVETVNDIRRGTTFTVASMMGGAGVLRPELCGAFCSVETAPA